MGLPGKVDQPTSVPPRMMRAPASHIPGATVPVDVAPPKNDLLSPKRPDEFTWANDGLSSCRNNMSQRSLPLTYPSSLTMAAQDLEQIRVQYCRDDNRASRMAFHFLQDGPKILFSDPEEIVRLKADLILAAAWIASRSSEFAVSVRQYADPAEAALSTLDLNNR